MSLNVEYDPNNIFAKLLRGEIPSAQGLRGRQGVELHGRLSAGLGHTLVVPKVAACNLFDIAPDDLKTLITETQRIARAVRDALRRTASRSCSITATLAARRSTISTSTSFRAGTT